MLNLAYIVNQAQKTLRDHSPSILTAIGVSGTVTTAYLAAKASWQASRHIHTEYEVDQEWTKREIFEEVWILYIPPVISGVVTITAIVGANHISSKRMAAAYSVAAVVEKGFEEYREKVVEQLGEKKEKAVRDEIAQDRVSENPPGKVIVSLGGEVLCCELFTRRYFTSDMESLRSAENQINAKLVREMYATLSDFYYIVGIPPTSNSGNIGWESSKLMQLEFSTVMSEDQKPCLAFEYNYTKAL